MSPRRKPTRRAQGEPRTLGCLDIGRFKVLRGATTYYVDNQGRARSGGQDEGVCPFDCVVVASARLPLGRGRTLDRRVIGAATCAVLLGGDVLVVNEAEMLDEHTTRTMTGEVAGRYGSSAPKLSAPAWACDLNSH